LAEILTPDSAGRCGRVLDAMRFAVLGGGQRIRPLLSMRIARSLDAGSRFSGRAGAAVELLHCASLIVDDLPCMDDEPERRGQPATHVHFGEAVAVLAAFGLVALAARSVVEQPCAIEDLPRLVRFQEYLLGTLDCDGLIAGQAMDLGVAGSHDRGAISDLKTVPLFELSARAGTLFANPSLEPPIIEFGRAYGSAFQAVDDYLDDEPVSRPWVQGRIDIARAALRRTSAEAADLTELVDLLEERIA
jgi:geranylgeranyl pyrophosphate synthase